MFDESFDKSNFYAIISKLTLSDLNIVLYRCDSEEKADGNGFGAYDIPGYGPMVYCGLRGEKVLKLYSNTVICLYWYMHIYIVFDYHLILHLYYTNMIITTV